MDNLESNKRKIDLFDEEVFKRLKTSSESILDFSDCVLTLILSYLDSYDLYRLSKTCSRFMYLVRERKLWKKVDIIAHPMCVRKFSFFFDNINNMTECIMLSGISRKEKTLTTSQFHIMFDICENLTILAIEHQYINSDEVRLSQFPKTLKELSLRGTHITGKQPFLQDAHKKLTELHTLILDDCKWFHEHSLMALSKLPSLENLSLFNCRNLNDSVAYMSVTARFGFTKLLRIDARCTPIGDQFLKCFHCIKTLREIYLESPPMCNKGRGSLFEEIKRWCTSNMQAVPNVVIFNQSTVNTVFKRNRKYKGQSSGKRHHKESKKSKSAPSSPVQRPILLSQPAFLRDYNCAETCDSCSMETCSSFLTFDKDPRHIFGTSRASAKGPRTSDNAPGTSGSSRKTREALWIAEKSDSAFAKPNTPSKEASGSSGSFRITEETPGTSSADKTVTVDADDVSTPPGATASGDEAPVQSPESTCPSEEKLESSGAPETPEVPARSLEMLYSDDVSDSEEELIDFQMFHSDVTDSGVQWFCSSDPRSVDVLGSNSMLFRKPYRTCECNKNRASSPNIDEPGPSGLNQPGPSSAPDIPPPSPRRPPSFFQDNPRRRVVFKRKKCRITEPPQHEAKRKCPDNPSITVDLSIGEGPLHLEIINEITGTIQRAPNEPPPNVEEKKDAAESSEEENSVPEPVRPVPPAPREEEEMRNRDLRVIIERLDPGLHIVIDRAGRIQFGPMRAANNYTKLKVFMARGYKMITDQALRSLSDLRLELLDVTGTSVTPSGIQQFLMVNPDCRVIHESICNCG